MLFLILLTVGFVYEYGKGALYFTDHRSAISLPESPKSDVRPPANGFTKEASNALANSFSRPSEVSDKSSENDARSGYEKKMAKVERAVVERPSQT